MASKERAAFVTSASNVADRKSLSESDLPYSETVPDLYRWARDQAHHIRTGQFLLLDANGVADEVEDVGHAEYDKLESALAVLLQHMLKWDFQAERRSRSWDLTIEEQRARVQKQLKRNPSLQGKLREILIDAYASARRRAYGETDLPRDTFPVDCPYAWTDLTERPFTHAD